MLPLPPFPCIRISETHFLPSIRRSQTLFALQHTQRDIRRWSHVKTCHYSGNLTLTRSALLMEFVIWKFCICSLDSLYLLMQMFVFLDRTIHICKMNSLHFLIEKLRFVPFLNFKGGSWTQRQLQLLCSISSFHTCPNTHT